MIHSYNVQFTGPSPGAAPGDHPQGEGIARLVSFRLEQTGYSQASLDDWRDCGSQIDFRAGDVRLLIALIAVDSRVDPAQDWLLQISSPDQPGPLAELFGVGRDCSQEMFAAARIVQELLTDAGYSAIRWCVDGFPDREISSPYPPDPAVALNR